ncbi:MAG: hypothetical protein HQM11_08610 [SAR324 cluster bacterium]|nr:hypothetical protein [SAR324 cluster bacterium]
MLFHYLIAIMSVAALLFLWVGVQSLGRKWNGTQEDESLCGHGCCGCVSADHCDSK